jgi:hypothetical protein
MTHKNRKSKEREGGLYYIGRAYILVFIRNGANLAHLFRKKAEMKKKFKIFDSAPSYWK